jgi:hypothetical protein
MVLLISMSCPQLLKQRSLLKASESFRKNNEEIIKPNPPSDKRHYLLSGDSFDLGKTLFRCNGPELLKPCCETSAH